MKVLVVGDGVSHIHERAVEEAFKVLGCNVDVLYWRSYFESKNLFKSFFLRFQNKYLIGKAVKKINIELIKLAIEKKPKLIFIYRGTHIYGKTIKRIKSELSDVVVFGYNNDDPFSRGNQFWVFRHFLRSIDSYDLIFSYRQHNVVDYISYGAKKVEVLMPWYLPKYSSEMNITNSNCKYDVIFVGHYEGDQRIKFLEKISESNHISAIYGPDWDKCPKYKWLQKYNPIYTLHGLDYYKVLRTTKVALCFLSALNRDVYTRRCFEIPALGVFLLCQYSKDLAEIFRDGIDMVFFHNPDDMMEKLDFYLAHEELRNKIALSGMSRVKGGGHDVVSRMAYVKSFIVEGGSERY